MEKTQKMAWFVDEYIEPEMNLDLILVNDMNPLLSIILLVAKVHLVVIN